MNGRVEKKLKVKKIVLQLISHTGHVITREVPTPPVAGTNEKVREIERERLAAYLICKRCDGVRMRREGKVVAAAAVFSYRRVLSDRVFSPRAVARIEQ